MSDVSTAAAYPQLQQFLVDLKTTGIKISSNERVIIVPDNPKGLPLHRSVTWMSKERNPLMYPRLDDEHLPLQSPSNALHAKVNESFPTSRASFPSVDTPWVHSHAQVVLRKSKESGSEILSGEGTRNTIARSQDNTSPCLKNSPMTSPVTRGDSLDLMRVKGVNNRDTTLTTVMRESIVYAVVPRERQLIIDIDAERVSCDDQPLTIEWWNKLETVLG